MSDYLKKAQKAGMGYDEIVPIDIYSIKELLEKLEREPISQKVPSGFSRLNEIIGGFEQERLYVMSGMTKQGKTLCAMTFMHQLARQGNPSMMFSYEMGWKEIVRQFNEMNEKTGAKAEIPLYMPIDLHRGGGELQYQWLYEAIAKAIEEKGIKFVVIDHLHFLLPLKDFNNTSFLIGGIVRELKRMAVALKVPIMLIAHTSKIKDDKIPDWTDIRDSSFITQEADMVMMIYRLKNKNTARKVTEDNTEETYTNQSILSVEVNRMGGNTGKVKLVHNGAMFMEEFVGEEIEVVNF